MNHFTEQVLQLMIDETNKKLEESSSLFYYKIGDPNGTDGVDLFHKTKGLIVNNDITRPRNINDSEQYLGKQ